jgi:hypothetical protein
VVVVNARRSFMHMMGRGVSIIRNTEDAAHIR